MISNSKVTNSDNSFDSFKKNLNISTKSLLKIKIPQKIVNVNKLLNNLDGDQMLAKLRSLNQDQIKELNKLINNLKGKQTSKVVSSSEDLSSLEDREPKIQFSNIPKIESHEPILTLVNLVKPILIEILSDVRTILLWIQLKVPEIADGNNFGVAVQEEVISCLKSIESELTSDLEIFNDYFSQRGKLCAKLLKFSMIQDFGQGILEHDEAFYFRLRGELKDIKNHYITLHNLCVKNLVKITAPRNEKNSIINSMY